MNTTTLRSAVSEIKQACAETDSQRSAFFFVIGAGISSPPLPLAYKIIDHCMQKATDLGRIAQPSSDKSLSSYSYWFELAYPQPKQRQQYLRGLIERMPISHANFRLAHLLLDGRVSNLVVTPNFDDQLSRALTLFGEPYIICDNPAAVDRIDPEQKDIQLVHVHGTYWFYDCCNLSGEIEERSSLIAKTNVTMASLLDQILAYRSPLVLGYSGWEGDVIMNSLCRRLQRPLPYKLYWFCFRDADVERLPGWLKDNSNVIFVTPSKDGYTLRGPSEDVLPGINKSIVGGFSETGMSLDKGETERTLPAQQVLDTFIEAFDLKAPHLTTDPLGFFSHQLQQSLPKEDVVAGGSDIYFVRSIIKRIERAKQREAETTQLIEADLESIRDAVRRSLYDEALQKALTIDLTDLNNRQVAVDLLQVLDPILGKLSYDPKRELECDELIVKVCDLLSEIGVADPNPLLILKSQALLQKANALDALDLWMESIIIYDELLTGVSNSDDFHLRSLCALAFNNKAIVYGNNQMYEKAVEMYEKAVETYDEVLARYSNDPLPEIEPRVARILVDKGVTLLALGKVLPAIKLFDEMLERFSTSTELKIQVQIAVALINKGRALGQLQAFTSEVETYDEVVGKFRTSKDVSLRSRVAVALLNKGVSLSNRGLYAEAVEAYDELLTLLHDEDEKELQELERVALSSRADALADLGEEEKALQAYEAVAQNVSSDSVAVAHALHNKAKMLFDKEREEDALLTFNDLIVRFANHHKTDVQELVASALIHKGLILSETQQSKEEIRTYDELVKCYGDRPETSLRVYVAKALINKCAALAESDRTEALRAYEELKRRFSTASESEIREVVGDLQ